MSSDVSRPSTISVSAYLRTAQCVQGQDDMGNDLLMARVELTPALDGRVCSCIVFDGLLDSDLRRVAFLERFRTMVSGHCRIWFLPSQNRLQTR